MQAQAVDVQLEDQQKINAFSRLNTKLHELEALLAAKKACSAGGAGVLTPVRPPVQPSAQQPAPLTHCAPPPQAEAEDLEEAGNEVMLLDDETVPYVVGEVLVHLPRDDVEARLQQGALRGAGEAGRGQGGAGGAWRSGAGQKAVCAATIGALMPPRPLLPLAPAALDEVQAGIKRVEAQMRETKGKMAELKGVLYAKFGNSVSVGGGGGRVGWGQDSPV